MSSLQTGQGVRGQEIVRFLSLAQLLGLVAQAEGADQLQRVNEIGCPLLTHGLKFCGLLQAFGGVDGWLAGAQGIDTGQVEDGYRAAMREVQGFVIVTTTDGGEIGEKPKGGRVLGWLRLSQ